MGRQRSGARAGALTMRVVFHADDFGLTPAVNAGIIEAHARGLLASASVMVTAGAAEDAVRAARAHPGLDLGLHLTLVEERPALPPARIPTLVSGDRFWPSHATIFLRYLAGRWSPTEAAAEVAAQFARLGALGVAPSHCDGHQHLHLLPALYPAVVAEARRAGVRYVRTRLGGPPGAGSIVRRAELAALGAVAWLAARRVPPDGASTARVTTVGFLEAGGAFTTPRVLAVLDALARDPATDVVEVMLHPGRRDADTSIRYGHWGYRWEHDLALLCDPQLRGGLAARGIEPTSFRALAAAAPGRAH